MSPGESRGIENLWTDAMVCPICDQPWDFDPERWEGQVVYCACGRGYTVERVGDGWRHDLVSEENDS